MSTINAIYDRHSVRQYQNQPLSKEVIHALQSEIDACNQESGLHIQLVMNQKHLTALWHITENLKV